MTLILGNPGFDCSFCSVMCGRKDNLLRHVRNCHLDPCGKKDQIAKKISGDSHNIDGEEVQNSLNLNDGDNVNKLSAVSTNGPSSLNGGFSQMDSEQNIGSSTKNDVVNKGSKRKKKTRPATNKSESKSKKIYKKKESRKLKRCSTVSSKAAATSGPSDVVEQVLKDKPEILTEDRSSVLITASTVAEVPVDLSKTESIITDRSQDNGLSLASAKTSVIVHTSSLHTSLLHEANSHREPVIRFFRAPPEPKSLVPDPT